MTDLHSEFEDIDERLDALYQRAHQLGDACQYRSVTRLANEMRRLAKSEQRIIAYLHSSFTVMNHAADLLEPESARDRAIELISLLESEDRARTIQPDLPEAEYAQTVAWMTACAYDNLAKATAQLNGYNSDGMHQCIGDGILVCRRTGKLECVTCFREYATDVYKAADDLDMAVHFSRVGMAHQDGPHDRRWIGARDLAQLLLLRGDVDAAAETVEQAWELAETYHTPHHARLRTKLFQAELNYLLGRSDEDQTKADLEEPPVGEFPWHEMIRDQTAAVGACCRGDYASAQQLLEKWDRLLSERQNLNEWFAHRLRLLAVHRLAGNERQLQRLSEPLATKARAARDWLTLRCLERILDPDVPPSPVPAVSDLQSGVFGASTRTAKEVVAAKVSEEPTSGEEPEATEHVPVAPPPRVQELWTRIAEAYQQDESQQSEAIDAILSDILAIDPTSVTSDEEASWLLHTANQVLGECERGAVVWEWAQSLTASRRHNATALSLLATLGARLRFSPNEAMAEQIDTDRLESMFRESLDLDPDAPRNFSRAGSYYMFMENLGEAERCFARGSRLDRADTQLALGLAEVYQRTDRARDALAVLDMCVREGCDDPEVFWKALITAFQTGQYETALAYIDGFEELVPDHPWANYYRAASLLELDRADEALSAAEEQGRRNPDCPFVTLMLETCAMGALGRTEEFRSRLTQILRTRLADIDYLSRSGLAHLFRRLWLAAACLPANDSLRIGLQNHLVATGLPPDELFESERLSTKAVPGVNFYEVTVQQPLDERWSSSPACLSGEEEWQSYIIAYGVLARDTDEAEEIVRTWQARCYPLPAEVLDITPGGEGYTDSPGVVWQSYREGAGEEMDLTDEQP